MVAPKVKKPSVTEMQLLEACQTGDKTSANSLLALGVSPNISGARLLPLAAAAEGGHTRIVQLLLRAGASVDATSDTGHTALRAATLLGDADCILALLEAGADINLETARGTPLVAASTSGDCDTIKLLLSHGAAVDVETKSGTTALLVAMHAKQAATVQLLLAHGASVHRVNADGMSALKLAQELKDPSISAWILQAQIGQAADEVLAASTQRCTAAELASEAEQQQVLQDLDQAMNSARRQKQTKICELRAEIEQLRHRFVRSG
ncbi:hypothetical protein WJX72_001257 [[Myrmecia] bisecta]|uniref:Uncharacterized protein n=1 Tax=[Myrmecia] bisecta TaxID=41462 RepID=A0AAW1QPR2_9CHLO